MLEPFKTALEFTLSWEGGYSNDPNDPGGETNFGISKRAHPEVDIANLSREQAALLYYRQYWVPAGCPALEPPVAVALFDFAVNSGVATATDKLGKIHEPDPNKCAVKLCLARTDYLCSLPHREVFIKGWMRRVVSLAGLVGGL